MCVCVWLCLPCANTLSKETRWAGNHRVMLGVLTSLFSCGDGSCFILHLYLHPSWRQIDQKGSTDLTVSFASEPKTIRIPSEHRGGPCTSVNRSVGVPESSTQQTVVSSDWIYSIQKQTLYVILIKPSRSGRCLAKVEPPAVHI